VAFTYLKVKSAKCLCLLPVVLVLVLLFWSWSLEFDLVYITDYYNITTHQLMHIQQSMPHVHSL